MSFGKKTQYALKYESSLHLAKEDPRLGNLKFILKGEKYEVFAMQIPNVLITDSIRNAPYYEVYLGMVAKHDRNIAAEKEGKKKSISKADPSKKPATMKQLKPKHVKENSSKPAPTPKPKSSLQLINEDEPSQPEPEPEPEHQGKGKEYDVERVIQISLESFQAQGQAHVGGVAIRELVVEATRPLPVGEGKGKAIASEEQAAQSLLALHMPKRKILDSPSPVDAKTCADIDKTNSGGDTEILQIGEEQGEDVDNQVNLEEKTAELDQGQDVLDPGKLNVEAEVVSMVTVLISQASSSVPPLSTPVIDLSPPKPVPSTTQAPIVTTTTTTTTTTLSLPPPPQQQSTTDPEVFTLELQDLPHKINQIVNEVVKEVVYVALQAPLRDRFRELPEADMK
ncbi:hypothetical protein Tco_1031767 [Tanacetum coccineum]|uniref:Uncharacterized protein n=1 Tax=Tanacetum coccineum TaxID=301880 RepID=A0ABQ5G9Y3_9ASTR